MKVVSSFFRPRIFFHILYSWCDRHAFLTFCDVKGGVQRLWTNCFTVYICDLWSTLKCTDEFERCSTNKVWVIDLICDQFILLSVGQLFVLNFISDLFFQLPLWVFSSLEKKKIMLIFNSTWQAHTRRACLWTCLAACPPLCFMRHMCLSPCSHTITAHILQVCICMCVWSVITGSWPSMLTQTCPADWPLEINKQTKRVAHTAHKQ